MHQLSPRSSPSEASVPLSSFSGRQAVHTSHPANYPPPPVLEPPANFEQRQSGSASGSPHMSAVGWQSPSQAGMASPAQVESYAYPDQYGPAGVMGTHLYYPNSNIRRPQSTEPHVEGYDLKQRIGGDVWATSVS